MRAEEYFTQRLFLVPFGRARGEMYRDEYAIHSIVMMLDVLENTLRGGA